MPQQVSAGARPQKAKTQASGSALIGKNVRRGKLRTSVRLEREMWSALDEIGRREGLTLTQIMDLVEDEGVGEGGFTSRIRVYVMMYFRSRAS